MCDTEAVSLLHRNVITQTIHKFQLHEESIREGIRNMKEAYKPDPTSLTLFVQNPVADYNDPAHRCGYLHKYASFHTALTADMFYDAALQNEHIFKQILARNNGVLNICSLGGGPGSDVLGVLSVLNGVLGFFQVRVTIVDFMEGWKETFSSLIEELASNWEGDYGTMTQWASPQYLQWSYLQCDLLNRSTRKVEKAMKTADLVTMVKFVSAAASNETSTMLSEIFGCLKPGSFVLYIDNSGGGFHQVVQRAAHSSNMKSAFGPLKHRDYSNENFSVLRFGYTPCNHTKVTVHMLEKQIPTRNVKRNQHMNQQPELILTPNAGVNRNPNNRNRRNRNRRAQGATSVYNNYVNDEDDRYLVDEDEDEVSCCVIA